MEIVGGSASSGNRLQNSWRFHDLLSILMPYGRDGFAKEFPRLCFKGEFVADFEELRRRAFREMFFSMRTVWVGYWASNY